MPARTILITGCSTGIGFQAAAALQARGYRVFASARKPEDVERLAAIGLESLVLDLESETSIDAALDHVLQRTDGTLDCLFNNGAYGQPGAVEDLPTAVLRRQFECNLFGWHHLTRRVIKVMRRQGYGRIVQNSSVLGFVCMPFRGAYNASKYALEALTDTLRLELAGTAIHVSLIEPGPIESDFRRNAAIKFREHIEWRDSVHSGNYRKHLERLEKDGYSTPFTLGPDAVTRCLIHALENSRPKSRYRVTLPTRLLAVLKRLLGTRALDAILKRA